MNQLKYSEPRLESNIHAHPYTYVATCSETFNTPVEEKNGSRTFVH